MSTQKVIRFIFYFLLILGIIYSGFFLYSLYLTHFQTHRLTVMVFLLIALTSMNLSFIYMAVKKYENASPRDKKSFFKVTANKSPKAVILNIFFTLYCFSYSFWGLFTGNKSWLVYYLGFGGILGTVWLAVYYYKRLKK